MVRTPATKNVSRAPRKVLGRVRALAAGWSEPLRLGYTTEAYVYECS